MRPGGLTAMGVASIIIGALSVLASVCSFFPVAQMHGPVLTQASPAPAATPPAPPPQVGRTDGTEGADGLGRADAYTVAAAWDGLHRLSPDRRTMLRRWLREFGRQLFPATAGAVTAEGRRPWSRRRGNCPRARTACARGTNFFRTGIGVILLDYVDAAIVPAVGDASAAPA